MDCLRLDLDRIGAEISTKSEVLSLKKNGGNFIIQTVDGKNFTAGSVILACGGKAAPSTGSDGSGFRLAESLGHKIIQPHPALIQLKLDGTLHKAMEGMKMGLQCQTFIL